MMHSAEYRYTETWPYHISAGGVVYRHQQGQLAVVVLYRRDTGGRRSTRSTGRVGNTS